MQFISYENKILNLSCEDVSMEILSDLVRKNVAEFSVKFFYFQYATREKCKGHEIIIQC